MQYKFCLIDLTYFYPKKKLLKKYKICNINNDLKGVYIANDSLCGIEEIV